MFSFLKNHPFAVEAFFDRSVVLTFAVPKAQLEPLIPGCLQLDVFDNQWAFVAVAMVQTKALRPKGFPGFMGNDFFLIGYRVFVRYTTAAGKRLRGLYILKSQTDKRRMEFFGNLFTHYNYTTTDIQQTQNGSAINIYSQQSGLQVSINAGENAQLPKGSPFADWKQARAFAGPLPFTFTCQPHTREVLIIEGVRQNWIPKPIEIDHYEVSFINQLNLQGVLLANAFMITDIPYYWKKGKKDQWSR